MRYFCAALVIFCTFLMGGCARFNHDKDYLKQDAAVSGLKVPMGANLPKEENYYVVPVIPPNTTPKPVSLVPPGSKMAKENKQ